MVPPSVDETRDRRLRYALSFVAAVTLLYAVLIAQQILLWVWLASTLAVLYLVWRFVRAHERLAAAAATLAAASAPGGTTASPVASEPGGESDTDRSENDSDTDATENE